jgi:hypothetical protein
MKSPTHTSYPQSRLQILPLLSFPFLQQRQTIRHKRRVAHLVHSNGLAIQLDHVQDLDSLRKGSHILVSPLHKEENNSILPDTIKLSRQDHIQIRMSLT